MEYKTVNENLSYGGSGGTSFCEEGGGGWCTSTPQPPRRPLQQLNTASPRPQPLLTPYKYHGCRVIHEEAEDQENVDPSTTAIRDSSSSSKSCGVSSEDTTNTGSSSSLFAYPLIWESNHSSTTLSGSSPPEGKKAHLSSSVTTWKSPVSHFTLQKNLSSTGSSEAQQNSTQGKGEKEDQAEDKEGIGKVKLKNIESSSYKATSHRGQTVTPSKTSHASSLGSDSVFLTPSGSMHSTKISETRGSQTPQQGRAPPHPTSHSTVNNPFEVGVESLYLSAVSPSLFQQVVSPSKKVDSNFRWSIDQLATLQPVNIETSPFTQCEGHVDPDFERQAQDAIDKFFTTHQTVVPSPWTGSNKSYNVLKLMSTQPQASPSLPPPNTQSVWCQTELSLPPVLPPDLEQMLKPFCTFTQSQWSQGSGGGGGGDEATSVNNTTLRRKLLFSHEELPTSSPMGSPRGADMSEVESCPSSPAASPTHKEVGKPEGALEVEEEEEEGSLAWCTAVLEPGMLVKLREGASLVRHSPVTPPSACHAPTSTSHHQPNSMHRPVMSPLPHTGGAGLLMSPDVSPIRDHQVNRGQSKHESTSITSPSRSLNILPRPNHIKLPPHVPLNSLDVGLQSSKCSPLHTPSPSGVSMPQNYYSKEGEWEGSPNRGHCTTLPQECYHPLSPCGQVLVQEGHLKPGDSHTAAGLNTKCSATGGVITYGDERNVDQFQRESCSLSNSHCQSHEGKPMVASFLTTEHTSSIISGHFSSSPISDTSSEDNPGRKFSASPPFFPILSHSFEFLSQTACLQCASGRKVRKCSSEAVMMDQSDLGPLPLPGCLQRSSSLCDMETDTQPSLESSVGEEMLSQDTGYQTASLHTSNQSMNTCSQDQLSLVPHEESSVPEKWSASSTKSKKLKSRFMANQ